MGAVISLIDWCLDRKDHRTKIQHLEDTLLEYEYKIEKQIATSTGKCFLDCCKNNIKL